MNNTMRRIKLVLLILPLFLLNLGCNSKDKAKESKALQKEKKAVEEPVHEDSLPNLEQIIKNKDADAFAEYIFKNAVTDKFKNMDGIEKKGLKMVFKDAFTLREGILSGDWGVVEEMAKGKGEHIFGLDAQKVADLKDYFNNPTKAPAEFMKTKELEQGALVIYVNAKLRGKTNIYEKLEGDNSVLKDLAPEMLVMLNCATFDDLAKQSADELRKALLESIKSLENKLPDTALIIRMFCGIVD
jgi:hypothetical protein